MMEKLIEEAARWDLQPKLASLWWSSTFAERKKEDMVIKTQKVQNKCSFEKSFKILGYIFHPAGRSQEIWTNVCRKRTKHGGEMYLMDGVTAHA